MRYLFAPAPTGFADDYLVQPRRSGECVCLGADLPFRSDDTWNAIRSRFPAGWQPDVIAVWMPDPHVPDCIWSAPVPVIGLMAGWFARGHHYRHLLPLCDGVFAPPPGVVALTGQGYEAVAVGDFGGLSESALAQRISEDAERDIDVLVLDPLTLPEPAHRNRFAGRIAELADICKVAIQRPTTLQADRELLARAKVVLQLPSPTGDERMSYEAIAAGALLLRPQYPWDGADWLRLGLDYVPYQELDLEAVVLAALKNEEERKNIVRTSRSRLREFQFANRLSRALAGLQPNLTALEQRAKERAASTPVPGLGGRIWASLAGGPAVDLPPAGSDEEPPEVTVIRGVFAASAAEAVSHFERAIQVEMDHPVAHANHAEALEESGKTKEAIAVARFALAQLDRTAIRPLIGWDVPLYPATGEASDLWEAAAWSANATVEAKSKRHILRWKLHLLLASLTGELAHYREAVIARPDWPTGRAALGCALAREGQPDAALPHLSFAADADPFDRDASRALYSVLRETDDQLGARLFARRNRRLAATDPEGCPVESWFAEATPVGDELVTIVIVDEQPEPPRACLEAVLRFSRPPFELLIIGPGDTEWLRDYRSENISALRVAPNLAPAELANRGIAQANGEFIAILDSRTRVNRHWLDRLLEPLCDTWPRVGAVGPVLTASSFASQNFPHSEASWAPRIAISCFLTHRAILDRIGKFDPALGGFAPDDWCVRAREAGFATVVASHVSLHGVDVPGTPADLEAFAGRWGEREGATYRQGENSWNRRPTVSACLIVRNEEAYLPECLESLADLVDDIVVIDTGSTDRTRDIAARFGARVFDFPWVDSFAVARNESIRRAMGDWIFWMDADDRLAEPEAFRKLTASLTFAPTAYVFKCICPHDDAGSSSTVVDHVRLFRNDPRLAWSYRVHEQILPSIRKLNMPVTWAPVTITHVGYAAPGSREKKLERDMRLLQLEDRDNPNDPFTQFNLGNSLIEAGRPADALVHLNRSLASSSPTDSIVRKLFAQIARCHGQLGNEAAAWSTVCAGRQHYPDDAELLTLSARHHEGAGEWEAAVACWRRLVDGQDDAHFASVPSDLRGESARRHLADAFQKLGREE